MEIGRWKCYRTFLDAPAETSPAHHLKGTTEGFCTTVGDKSQTQTLVSETKRSHENIPRFMELSTR